MVAKRHYAKNLHLSQRGADFLAAEEGVRLRPYRDSRGLATTGVGHLIQPAHVGVTPQDIAKWSFPSAKAAVDYFRKHDVIGYERAVKEALGPETGLTQAQYDMCVSLCFNIGAGGFARSAVAHHIRANHMQYAGDAFMAWANPSVLRPRRQRERARFLLGHW